jgi:hypothetical protein
MAEETTPEEFEITVEGGMKIKVAPIFVSAERTVQGNDRCEWGFDLPDGIEPRRVVCILAELR